MKTFLIVVCLVFASVNATPLQKSFGIGSLLETLDEGYESAMRVADLVHHIERLIATVRNEVPHLYHEYRHVIDELETDISSIVSDVEELLFKPGYGFDLLDGLTGLTDGTKLGTAMRLLSLADKAHKFVNDLKHAAPDAQERIQRVLDDVEKSMTELTHHIIQVLGGETQQAPTKILDEIEEFIEHLAEETLIKVANVIVSVDNVIVEIEEKFPHVYEQVKHVAEDLRTDIIVVVNELKALIPGYNFLDVVGTFTDGTKIGTVMKVLSLIDKFNTFVKDVKEIEPRAEIVLQHSVKIVAEHTQDLLTHASTLLSKY